ncbi:MULTISPECIES: response regulator transcription factor [Paenibacillus]|uniref:DNA-binding response regulator n=1 Tax=Paenibacillus campinasensis TaxID=66347 RepID=A0A268EZE6_9BACL|nr:MULTISPECIES: response regulator [Paenibacillus]PAD78502.1 DNA-binding response regulator [Paenibacillus campinasensis]PAK52421.1 DNA-binding response regulator [Paenibacillus sp. 7541]
MKVLIVDDEVIIRNGLSTVIKWSDYGFTMLPPAASAEEALQRIPDEMPDIIFTDIRMTGISGLDMAHEVKQQFPGIEIIVISGFDEFTYAQQAMREGVRDYLLKTSRPGEIVQAALKVKDRLEKRRQSQAQGKAQEMVVNRGFLRRLLASGVSPDEQAQEEFKERFPDLRMDEGQGQLQVWMLSIRLPEHSGDGSPGGDLLGLIGGCLAESVPCAWLEWSGMLLVLTRVEEPGALSRMDAAIRKVQPSTGYQIISASGESVSRLGELPRALDTAVQASSYMWLLGGEQSIRYADIGKRKGIRTVCSVEEESELSSLLRSGSRARLEAWVAELFERIRSSKEATPGSAEAYLNSLLVAAQRWLERAAASIGYTKPLQQQDALNIRELNSRPDELLFQALERIMKQYGEMSAATSPVQRAVEYIHEHLGLSLSLQQVARHVHMNPNYFSEMFKKETGQNYIEFVTQAKLRKAMILLKETPAKVSEIANDVGYEDIKYFNRLFKKFTGQTPSEYRTSSEFCPSID